MKIQFFRHFFPFFLKKKFCGRIFSFVGKNDLFVAFAMATKHGHFSQIDFFALTIGQTAWAIWARLIVKIFTFLMKNSIYFAFSVGKSYFGSFYMKDNKHLIDFFHDFPNKICFVIKNFNMNHLGSF